MGAFALAGRVDIDLKTEPLGKDAQGNDVYLADIWPPPAEVREIMDTSVRAEMFRKAYGEVFRGSDQWRAIPVPEGDLYGWDDASTYVKRPPFFDDMSAPAASVPDLADLRALAVLGDTVTTDHISPAGVWLRFRGHLENISDNMFSGAVDAFTDEAGVGRDPLSGESGVPFSSVARHIVAKGLRWVVVGDENYGEGSSREHAAMSPRLLGAAAVIVRSFARIHEANLKKQGVLPLSFSSPEDYEKVRQGDRVSVLGLAELAPGRPLRVVLHHEGGSEETFAVSHTLNDEQISWFRAGSALNLLRAGA